MKILVCCISGMGSSQMIKMKISNVLKKLGITATIDHKPIGEGKSMAKNYDAIFCSSALVDNFKDVDPNKIPTKTALNLLGKDVGECRLPLTPMSAQNREKLTNAMSAYGLRS